MSDPIWKPNATVAVVVERDGRYLLVEELTPDGVRYNQPAGHLDHGESLLQAAVREALEETGCRVWPTALVGIYQWSPSGKGELTYLRFAYAAELVDGAPQPAGLVIRSRRHAGEDQAHETPADLDEGILRALWLSYDEVLACRDRHRSPLVLQCLDDYRAGRRYPLELIAHHD